MVAAGAGTRMVDPEVQRAKEEMLAGPGEGSGL